MMMWISKSVLCTFFYFLTFLVTKICHTIFELLFPGNLDKTLNFLKISGGIKINWFKLSNIRSEIWRLSLLSYDI